MDDCVPVVLIKLFSLKKIVFFSDYILIYALVEYLKDIKKFEKYHKNHL